jgi:MFS family permease
MFGAHTSGEPLFTRRFAGLWLFSFLVFASAFQLFPAIPFRILALGGTKAAAGRFLAVYTFASAFAAPLMGTVADHFGRKRVLIGASAAFVIFSIAYGLISHLPTLLVIGAIHGTIWSGILSSSSAIMSDYIPESRRTEGIAYWGLASSAAVAIAPSIGLWVAQFGWRTLCFELAAISVVMVGWASRLTDRHEVGVERSVPAVRELFDMRVTIVALSLFNISFGYGGVTSYVAILATERGIRPPALFFTVFALTIVAVRVLTSPLGDRYGAKTILYPGLALVPFGLLLLATAHSRAQLVGAALVFGAGFGGTYPAFVTFILNSTDPRRRARTFGSIIWAFDTGIGSGSLLVGALGQRYGLGKAFIAAALVSCLAIPVFVLTSARIGLRRNMSS